MITLAHLSDMHISPLPDMRAREFTLKRALAYVSWHRKRKHRFSIEVLQSLIADVHAAAPDQVLVTGDQCNLSLDAEFVHAAAWLARMGTPETVAVIPGNHDAHRRHPEKTWGTHWHSYMQGDDGRDEFPYLRRRGGVAIIGVSSAIPTVLLMANGRVGESQRARLRTVLHETKAEGLCRVVMIHHPPHAGMMTWRKALSDAPALRAVLAEAGAELVLHGHGHVAVRAELVGPDRPIAVRGAASASGNGRGMPPAHYHRIAVTPHTERWELQITHRQYDLLAGGFRTVDEETLSLPRPALQGFDRVGAKH